MNQDLWINAQQELGTIAEELEKSSISHHLEIEFSGNILEIDSDDGSKYLINIHEAMGQIWYSSAKSGAHHFVFDNNEWHSTRDPKIVFRKLLMAEILTKES